MPKIRNQYGEFDSENGPGRPLGSKNLPKGPEMPTVAIGRNQYGEFEAKSPLGRPTKWTPEINEKIVAFFSVPPTRTVMKVSAAGVPYEAQEANYLPLFEKFAADNDLNADSLVEWAKPENVERYPGFSAAYKRCKQLQMDILLQNGLAGRYAPAFAIFTAKNITSMRDVRQEEVTGRDGAPLQSAVIMYPAAKELPKE
jgi:hypothetical protein